MPFIKKKKNKIKLGHCEKLRKCWLPAFSLFPKMFSKGLFFWLVKCLYCVEKC